jgi:hypothetical protein
MAIANNLLLHADIEYKPSFSVLMKKLFWVLAPSLLMISLIVLTIALTDKSPENPLKEYRLIIGLGVICIAGFIRIAYRKIYK